MIKFAGKDLPSFVRINGINYSMLAPIEHKTGTIQGRAGVYDFGIEYGYKQIEVEFQLIADNQADVISKARQFATWLYYKDLQPLFILDEPDKYYMARVVGDTNIDEVYRVGSGSIQFVVPSGYAESVTEKLVTASPTAVDSFINVTNDGTAETYPVIELTMKQETENVTVIADNGYVRIGDIDATDTVALPAMTSIYSDGFTTYTGWTSGLPVDGGTVAGSFALASTGKGLKQSGDNYGTGSTWHGASAYKALSKQLTNFEVQTQIVWDHLKPTEIGRMEVYLLDTNNSVIGKFGLYDASITTKMRSQFIARAGGATGGVTVGNNKGYAYDKKKKKAYWLDLDNIGWAYMSIRRVGNKWTFYTADLLASKGSNKHYNPRTYTYVDRSNKFNGKQLAKIQLHVATYGANNAVKRMEFTSLKVYEVNSINDVDRWKDLRVGDVIEIDNSKAIVTRNGQPYFTGLDPASDFFAFQPGQNQLAISPPVADVKVAYRERYL